MAAPSTIVIAGAGIGGLTAALALARQGLGVRVVEQAARLEETGAGLQLTPNATRILLGLGLGEQLRPLVVAPERLSVHAASSGRQIAAFPLGATAEARYGAPYWVVHRADLQSVLVEALAAHPEVAITLDARLDDFTPDAGGVTVRARRQSGEILEQHGSALVGADGLWSGVRARLDPAQPRFRGRVAFRASVPAAAVATEFRAPAVHLWLGPDAHLVHYPVKAGALVNIVAIVHDRWEQPGWSAAAARDEVLARFPTRAWAAPARDLLALPERWLKWALYDLPPLTRWGDGPVTLLGDAAHPMLPFLAQGAGSAIEDAAVLAAAIAAPAAATPGADPVAALRAYETMRRSRTADIQRSASRTGAIYGLGGLAALARNAVMGALGGDALLARQDWIYGWRAPRSGPAAAKDT